MTWPVVTWLVAALVLTGCVAAGALTGLVPYRGVRVVLLGAVALAAFLLFAPSVCAVGQSGATPQDVAPVGWCESSVGLRLPEFGASTGDAGYGWAFVAAAVTVLAGTSAARARHG